MLSDAHVHLDFYPEAERPGVIQRAQDAGVELMVTVGYTLTSCQAAVALANQYKGIVAGVGLHPWKVVPWRDEVEELLRELVRDPKVKVISEIGLDYTKTPKNQREQRELFRRQVAFARELRLPVMTHNDRPSDKDFLSILRDEGGADIGGIIHGFRSDYAFARDCLDMGFVISFGRGILRPTGEEQVDVLRRLPREWLAVETDAAGQPEGPAEVLSVARRVGVVLDVSEENVGDFTTANLKRILRI